MPSEVTRRPVFMDPPRVLALTLAFAALAFCWSKLLGMPWRPITMAAVLAAALWTGRWSVRESGGMRSWIRSPSTLLGMCLLLLLLALRFYPLMGALAPPGGDMSMHTLLTRVAVENSVLPDTQTPIYPGIPYGAYPLGFHGLAALVAWSPDRVGLASRILIALSHAIFAAGIYTVLRTRVSNTLAFLSALATVLILRNPQGYIGWGGYPCVLGFAVGIFAWQSMVDYLRAPSVSHGILVAVLTSATALIHPTAALSLAIALVGTFAMGLVRRDFLSRLRAAAPVGILSVVLALPIFIEVWKVDYSTLERGWVAANHLSPPQSPKPSLELLPGYWNYAFGDVAVILAGLGLAVLFLRRRWREGLALTLFITAAPYLMTWYRHTGYPGSLSMYPERVMLMLVVPWAILISQVLSAAGFLWRQGFTRWRAAQRVAALVLALGIVAVSGMDYQKYYFDSARDAVVVKDVDLRAFDAIRVLASDRSLVSNQVGDAAAFLPGLWGVAATHPQYNPIWRDELDRWLSGRESDFLYCRSDRPCDQLPALTPGRFEFLHRFNAASDTVTVWVVLRGPVF